MAGVVDVSADVEHINTLVYRWTKYVCMAGSLVHLYKEVSLCINAQAVADPRDNVTDLYYR